MNPMFLFVCACVCESLGQRDSSRFGVHLTVLASATEIKVRQANTAVLVTCMNKRIQNHKISSALAMKLGSNYFAFVAYLWC
jgi:hypothetical protein